MPVLSATPSSGTRVETSGVGGGRVGPSDDQADVGVRFEVFQFTPDSLCVVSCR